MALHRRRRCAARRWDGQSTASAVSTLGTFLRSFRWGHVRQLEPVAGPGMGFPLLTDHPWTPRRERAATLARWVSPAAGHCRRHRRGAGPVCARAGAHFLRETVGRVRYGGATHSSRCGPTAASMATPSWTDPPARQPAGSAIPEEDWTPFPTGWTAAEPDDLHPLPTKLSRAGRLIVRRVATPGSQLPLPDTAIRSPDGEGIAATPGRERHTHLKYGVGLNHMPSRSQRRLAGGPGEPAGPRDWSTNGP